MPELKYPRRSHRTINNFRITLFEPSEQTSKTMQQIRTKNTEIEQILKIELEKRGIKYSSPEYIIENIPGKPDIVIPRYKLLIFCDGDFWHGYSEIKTQNNSQFWSKKISRNVERDKEVNSLLENEGWTVFRFWEHDIKQNASCCIDMIIEKINEIKKQTTQKFTFVDLFAGIGGFRIPLEELGGRCIAFSEIDKHAIDTYEFNFWSYKNNPEKFIGDITKVDRISSESIDVIVGGVPCQSWSVAGKMKGFDDPRGKLWYDTIRLVKIHRPKLFIFENVKGLMDPRNRESLGLIRSSFENIGYNVHCSLLNSYDFGVPQNRDRLFLVGFRDDLRLCAPFEFPTPIDKHTSIGEILENHTPKPFNKRKIDPKILFNDKIPRGRNRFQKDDELNDFFIFCDTRNGHSTIHSWDLIRSTEREKIICFVIMRNRRRKVFGPQDGNPISFEDLNTMITDLKKEELDKLIGKKILRYIENRGYEFVNSKNSSGINGIYRIYLPHSKIFSTLTATGTKDMVALDYVDGANVDEYKENFIKKIYRKKRYRNISGRESGALQGFPKWFKIHENEYIAKKQFGNAVSVPVVYYLMEAILSTGALDNE